MTEKAVPAPQGAEGWKANIPLKTVDDIQGRALAPYEHPLTKEIPSTVAVMEPVQEADNLPRSADGTIQLGPQGWKKKWNRPSGATRVDTTPMPVSQDTTEEKTDRQASETVSHTDETQGKHEQKKGGAEETVVYQAPNRLPGSTRRVQQW